MSKDIEWLKEEINWHEQKVSFFNGTDYKVIPIPELRRLINQLDEPEVLSQEWIEENSALGQFATSNVINFDKFVKADRLEKLLVPKQEELESKIKVLIEAYEQEDGQYSNPENAWIAGFIGDLENLVEEEPKYRARLKVITDEFIASYLRTQSSNAEDRLKALEIGSKYIHEDYRHLSEFTEDELKSLDIWDSDQWEIEELEE